MKTSRPKLPVCWRCGRKLSLVQKRRHLYIYTCDYCEAQQRRIEFEEETRDGEQA